MLAGSTLSSELDWAITSLLYASITIKLEAPIWGGDGIGKSAEKDIPEIKKLYDRLKEDIQLLKLYFQIKKFHT